METYDLPVLFTEEERRKYAEWGCRKEKVLIPFAVTAIVIDVIVLIGTAIYFLSVREHEPYFAAWMSAWGGLVGSISYGAALFFTALILKPLDIILDKIYKKPKGPRSLCLSPGEGGVRYILTQDKKILRDGLIPWELWSTSVSAETNEIYIDGECLRIGANTIETIYPQEKQHKWMDRPEEKITGSISLKKISRNFDGYLASLEAKRKEKEWRERCRQGKER